MLFCYRASDGTDYWIGLYKSAPLATDNCYWLDGNPSTFRNWVADEPNTADMCIRMSTGGVYRDIGCSSLYGYICKMDEGKLSQIIGLISVISNVFQGDQSDTML